MLSIYTSSFRISWSELSYDKQMCSINIAEISGSMNIKGSIVIADHDCLPVVD